MNNHDKSEIRNGSFAGDIAAIWGVTGICLILGVAVYRMASHVLDGFQYYFSFSHYALLVPWLFFMLYSEGYKGFQKSFSPRAAARAVYLRENATVPRAILAPVFCMGFFDSTKKRKIVIWCLTIAIACFVIAFRFIPQPWRGILDLGVLLGLTWGIVATVVYFFRYWFGEENGNPEVPQNETISVSAEPQ